MNDTSCKNCCFAIYDLNDEVETQTGCLKNVLNKYRLVGSEVIDAYDQEKEFNVIKNRYCPYYRTSNWYNKVEHDVDLMNRCLEFETALSFHVIVVVDDVDKLKTTVDSLKESTIRPIQATFIGNQSDNKEIAELIKDLPFKWKTQFYVDRDVKQEEKCKLIHEASKQVNSQYLCVIECGQYLIPDLFQQINIAVIDNLLQFAQVKCSQYLPDLNAHEFSWGVNIVPIEVHNYWYYKGNAEKTVIENIKEYQCKNPKKKIIYTKEDLIDYSHQSELLWEENLS